MTEQLARSNTLPNAAIAHRHGVLLIGHGTRDSVGVAEFFATVELVREALVQHAPVEYCCVEPCFLELAAPSISEGLEALAGQGVERITVLPLLLFAAGHANEDIPAAVAQAAAGYPETQIRQAAHLGCHPNLLALSSEHFREAVAGRTEVAASETTLLLVGRGSRDDEASAEMRRFAQLRAAETIVGRVEVCFLAMAKPSLDEALEKLVRHNFRRIVVQPHLLFGGLLLAELHSTVQRKADERGDIDFIVTDHLGPSPLLAAAIVERLKA